MAAVFDFINALPDDIKAKPFLNEILQLAEVYLPGFEYGFGWIIPSVVGFVIGVIMWQLFEKDYIHEV